MIRSLLDRGSRRLPAELARRLPLAPRERVLRWAEAESGTRLIATTHGLWEWPPDGVAERLCWRDVAHFHIDAAGSFSASRHLSPAAHLHVGAGNDLPRVVQSMVDSSRLVEQHFRLPSGSRLVISARDCPYERSISWSSALSPAPGADPAADERLAGRVLARARAEYGTGDPAGASSLGKPVRPPTVDQEGELRA